MDGESGAPPPTPLHVAGADDVPAAPPAAPDPAAPDPAASAQAPLDGPAAEMRAIIAAEDWPAGIALLEERLSDLVREDVQMVRTFLEVLPVSAAAGDPMIELGISVFAGLDAGTAGSVSMISRAGETLGGAAEAGWSHSDIVAGATARIVLLRLSGDFDAGARLAREVAGFVRERPSEEYGLLSVYRDQWAIVHELAGDLAAADEQFRAAFAEAKPSGIDIVTKNCAGTLAMNDALRGEVRLAGEWLAVEHRYPDPEGWLAERVRIPARVADVLIALDLLDIPAADAALAALGMPGDTEEFWAPMIAAHAAVLLLRGRAREGLDLLDRVGHQFARWAPPGSFAQRSLDMARADFLTALGLGGEALRVLAAMPQELPAVRARTARVHLLRDDAAAAIAVLGDCANAAHWSHALIDMLTMSAAAQARTDRDGARVQLRRAEAVAGQAGAVRPLLMLPREHRRGLLSAGLVPDGLREVWERHDAVDVFPHPVESVTLTERELAVLRHVAQGASRREVAAALFVSENTVKTQLSSIYRKLGAAGRDEAVAEAQRLSLL